MIDPLQPSFVLHVTLSEDYFHHKLASLLGVSGEPCLGLPKR
jgi:hypothetical protein